VHCAQSTAAKAQSRKVGYAINGYFALRGLGGFV